ncbi:MAG: aminoacyl-tRNA hydrolase [Trueperaceae bacterium]|nr:MAG: aminoacyl-tRNA hydrolase [Trueperaceae bacterium]
MRLVVGLGNPGPRYKETRHNVGYLVLDELARRFSVAFRKTRYADEVRVGRLVLLKPTTMMNASGLAVQAAVTKNRFSLDDVLVIHDDLDLPLGRLRLKAGGGGAGGARGVEDIARRLGPNFVRLKVGITRPPEGWEARSWVLSRFAQEEAVLLRRVIEVAADAVELLSVESAQAVMSRFNGLDIRDIVANEHHIVS